MKGLMEIDNKDNNAIFDNCDEDAKEKSIEILNSNGTFLTTLPSKYLNSLSDIISFAGNFIWKFKNK